MARPRLHDDGYLKYLSTQPCCICGKEGETQACHIRIGFLAMQKKPDDRFSLAMCCYHHAEQHKMREENFWHNYSLDPFAIAAQMYGEYGGDGGAPRVKRDRKPRPKKAVKAKIACRGFDKTKTRKFNGKIVERGN